MAADRWSDEESALFIADVNTWVLPKAIAWMAGCLVILLAGTYFLESTIYLGIMFGLSILTLYPLMEYSVVLVSVLNKLDIQVGRTLFFRDRAGYRAKLKANPELRSFKPTKNQKLIAWGIVAVLAIALFAALQG